jgi:hypothetical protein
MEGHRLFVELVDPDKTEDGRYREGGVTETLSDRPGLLLPSITGLACTISRTSLTSYCTSPHSVFL